jgi:hypothetical protein
MVAKSQLGGLVMAAALAGVCGSGSAVSASGAGTTIGNHSATLHFDRGLQVRDFRLHEPAGVILLYRVSAPRGAVIRGSAQLPGVTVPLQIATRSVGPSSSCSVNGSRVTCTVGEEWCPMPEGTWRFRVEKLAGPEGDVTLWFRVGDPPGQSTT